MQIVGVASRAAAAVAARTASMEYLRPCRSAVFRTSRAMAITWS